MHPATKNPPLQGTLAELPTLPDTSIERGQVYQCSDRDLSFYLAVTDAGAQAWRSSGGVAPLGAALYIDPVAGKDDRDGLTWATAIKTVTRLAALWSFVGYTGFCRVYVRPGTTLPWPVVNGTTLNLFVPVGMQANQLGDLGFLPEPACVIGGQDNLSGSVALAVDSADGLTLTFAKGAFVTGALDQLHVEFLDGPSAGAQVRVVTSTVAGPNIVCAMSGSFGAQTAGTHVAVMAPNVTISGGPVFTSTGADQPALVLSQVRVTGGFEANALEFAQDRCFVDLTDAASYVRMGARVDGTGGLDFMPAQLIDPMGLWASGPDHGGSLIVLHYAEFFPGGVVARNVALQTHTHCDVFYGQLWGDNAPVAADDTCTIGWFSDPANPSYITGVRTGNLYTVEGFQMEAGTDFAEVVGGFDRCHFAFVDGAIHDNDLIPLHAADHCTMDTGDVTGANPNAPCGMAVDGASAAIVGTGVAVTGSNPGVNDLRLGANPRSGAGGVMHAWADLAGAPNATLSDAQLNVVTAA
jgi:hypothetical protein